MNRRGQRFLENRRKAVASGDGIDWATAEALAFCTLLRDGTPVRLSGQDPELVFVGDEPEGPVAGAEEGQTARISLRLPDALKTAIEAAAAGEGVSVNTWIVRALSRSTTAGSSVQSGNRLTGYARS